MANIRLVRPLAVRVVRQLVRDNVLDLALPPVPRPSGAGCGYRPYRRN
ncbi:hypothetical protein [Streptomyces sp. Ac-502]